MGRRLRRGPGLRQWLWFVGLWIAGVASLGVVAWSIRFWLFTI